MDADRIKVRLIEKNFLAMICITLMNNINAVKTVFHITKSEI